LYRYRLRERDHSGFLINTRLLLVKLANDIVVFNLFPFHELLATFCSPELMKIEEKVVRYHQYKNFMAKRDSKYDFLELGVLEKFPYPTSLFAGEKGPME
jgi:hypothetical protein